MPITTTSGTRPGRALNSGRAWILLSFLSLSAGCRTSSYAQDEANNLPGDVPGPTTALSVHPVETLSNRQSSAETSIESAIEAFEAAEQARVADDPDEALAALDRAYLSMLSIDEEGSGQSERQIDELRLMIAKAIVTLHEGRAHSLRGPVRAIPLTLDDSVMAEIRSFQTLERDFFESSFARSGRFRAMILEKLKKAGVPEELAWLPLIESGFKPRALSPASALGLWQFIPSTGVRFGLDRNEWIDERLDPEAATDAAIRYLTELHGLFGDWELAIAAYNCGESRVADVIRTHPSPVRDFSDIAPRLPRETRRYVPRFVATLLILNDPETWGFDLPLPDVPASVARVRVDRSISLTALEAKLGLASGRLLELNPVLRRGVTPPSGWAIAIPVDPACGLEPAAAETIAAIPAWVPETAPSRPARHAAARGDRKAASTHVVRKGESLSGIAARYKTDVAQLRKLNGLSKRVHIIPGQTLKLTGKSATPKSYVVRRGDNLARIAERHGTTVGSLREMNGLDSDLIRAGQKLRVSFH